MDSSHDGPDPSLHYSDPRSRVLRRGSATLRLLIGIPTWATAVAMTVLMLLLGLPIAATIVLAAGNTFSPFDIAPKWRLRHLAFAVIVGLVLHKFMFSQIQSHADAAMARVEAAGPQALSLPECLGIYVFGAVMAVGGYAAGYPDAAREHLGLYRDGPITRSERSEFPMKSVKVKSALDGLAQAAAKSGKARELRKHLTFSRGSDALAAVYALDPLDLMARAEPTGDGVVVEASAEVAVSYPKSSRTRILTLWGGQGFFVDEGLFWALQERGWLHPYRDSYVWRYTVPR